MTPMPPIAPAPPVAEPQAVGPLQLSAFQRAAPGATLFADPAAMGRSILASLDGFQTRADHVKSVTDALHAGQAPAADTAAPVAPAAATGPATNAAAERQMLGVLLETYDFAMQTEMVTRAATTFTSSVNTLIKAQ